MYKDYTELTYQLREFGHMHTTVTISTIGGNKRIQRLQSILVSLWLCVCVYACVCVCAKDTLHIYPLNTFFQL